MQVVFIFWAKVAHFTFLGIILDKILTLKGQEAQIFNAHIFLTVQDFLVL